MNAEPSFSDKVAAFRRGEGPDPFIGYDSFSPPAMQATPAITLKYSARDDAPVPVEIPALAFAWPDPSDIPRRRWLLGRWLLRSEITALAAPGGVGKSTLTTAMALSLASGRDLIGKRPYEGPCGVWLFNLEDDETELARQITATALHHGLTPDDCSDRLFVNSGLDTPLCTAVDTADGLRIAEPVYDELKYQIERRDIAALIVDPFVSSHDVSENDNGKIDAVAKRWKRLAVDTGCAIVLVHHTRKTGGRDVTVEDARGAFALLAAARIGLTLNPMAREDMARFGVDNEAERRTLIRLEIGKANRSAPEGDSWFKLHSVDLRNGNDNHPSDLVGAAGPWLPPDPFADVSVADIYAAQCRIASGSYGAHPASNDWAGHIIADILGLDTDNEIELARLKSIIKVWTKNGKFKIEKRDTGKGRLKPFLVVDEWSNPTSKTGVGKGGETGVPAPPINAPHPTPPLGGGCGESGERANHTEKLSGVGGDTDDDVIPGWDDQ